MKILFITGCIEEGRDGIGDNTLILASYCNQLGAVAMVIGLNDFYLKDFKNEIRAMECGDVETVRFPSVERWKIRFEKIAEICKTFKPDVISFQYCGYSFNKKGVPLFLGTRLKKAAGNIPVQIMFHELWAGSDRRSGWKNLLWGAIQQLHVSAMIKKLAPVKINVSTRINKSFLKNKNFNSTQVSILNNIPIKENPAFGWIEEEIKKQTALDIKGQNIEFKTFGLFGTIYPSLNEDVLLPAITSGLNPEVKIIIISAGKMGAGRSKWEEMKLRYNKIYFVELGAKSAGEISEFLHFINYGITTTSPLFVGKSSTFMAMMEHGLTVFVNQDTGIYPSFSDLSLAKNDQLVIIETDYTKINFHTMKKYPPSSKSKAIAENFLNEIAAATN